MTKIRPITKLFKKLAGMTCHLINKAVMKQNCIEALNQNTQPLKKIIIIIILTILQCFDVVRWAAGRASGL